MLIKQITNSIILDDFRTYVKTLPSARLDKSTTRKIKNTLSRIKNEISTDALYFEMQESEMALFKEIWKAVVNKHHLAVAAFVDSLATTDSVVNIKKTCEDADFYEAFPSNNITDNKIKLYVGYFKNSSGFLDTDFVVNLIFSNKKKLID